MDSKSNPATPAAPAAKLKRKVLIMGNVQQFHHLVDIMVTQDEKDNEWKEENPPAERTPGASETRSITSDKYEIEFSSPRSQGGAQSASPFSADIIIHAVDNTHSDWGNQRFVIPSANNQQPISCTVSIDGTRPNAIKQTFAMKGPDDKPAPLGTFSPSEHFNDDKELRGKLSSTIKKDLSKELRGKLSSTIKKDLPADRKEKIDAFKRIYTALREGQSQPSWMKTNYLSKITAEDDKYPDILYNRIQSYAEANPNSRAAKAWHLMNMQFAKGAIKDLDRIKDLEREIYQWSFANSGWFKMSKVTGHTFFSSKSLSNYFTDIVANDHGGEPDLSKTNLPQNAAENSRLDKIRKVLRKK